MLPATTVAAPSRLVAPWMDLGQRADDLPERLDRDQRRRSVRTAMPQLSAEARDLNWLVGTFAKRTQGWPMRWWCRPRAAGGGL